MRKLVIQDYLDGQNYKIVVQRDSNYKYDADFFYFAIKSLIFREFVCDSDSVTMVENVIDYSLLYKVIDDILEELRKKSPGD